MSEKTLDLAIVTSVHNYGEWLDEWAASIIEQDGFRPAVTAIVDNGSTDLSSHKIIEAAAKLEAAGIECRTERIPLQDFGTARNRAVEISGETEWVMHLDADDHLMRHCLSDVAKLMPEADVVSLGYERSGDLKAGPTNRTRTYEKHRGEGTLRAGAPASGVSPFRREFWRQSPYRTDMPGGWDTALWIGFAHLNARFVPTRRPVFYYRQHADSIFNSRRVSDRKTMFVAKKLRNLRRQYEGVSVLIPWKYDGGHRRASFNFVRSWYQEHHPEWTVHVGEIDGPWRKGEAIRKAREASSGDRLIIADADCIVEPEALRTAVKLIEDHDVPWVIPHTMVHRLDEPSSREIYRAGPADAKLRGETHRPTYKGFAGGGMLVIERSKFEATGGIPSQFVGWGAEDEALATILDSLVGPHVRLDFDLFHLWHKPGRRGADPKYPKNRGLFRSIRRVRNDPDLLFRMLRILDGGGDPEDVLEFRQTGGIMMVAIETFKRGSEIVEKGDTFKATEREARRHESRSRTMARRVNGSALSVVARHDRNRTLDIRVEQAMRNEKAKKERAGRRRDMIESAD